MEETKKEEQQPEVKEEEKKEVENPGSEEEKGLPENENQEDGQQEDEEEELIAIPKSKLEQLRKNAFAEGQRKASKKEPQVDTEKEDLKRQLAERDAQLNAFKITIKMDTLGVQKERQEDLVAILKGKGIEVNEENISKEAEGHPEWITTPDKKGVEQLGQGLSKNEEEEIKKVERLDAKIRKSMGLPPR